MTNQEKPFDLLKKMLSEDVTLYYDDFGNKIEIASDINEQFFVSLLNFVHCKKCNKRMGKNEVATVKKCVNHQCGTHCPYCDSKIEVTGNTHCLNCLEVMARLPKFVSNEGGIRFTMNCVTTYLNKERGKNGNGK